MYYFLLLTTGNNHFANDAGPPRKSVVAVYRRLFNTDKKSTKWQLFTVQPMKTVYKNKKLHAVTDVLHTAVSDTFSINNWYH